MASEEAAASPAPPAVVVVTVTCAGCEFKVAEKKDAIINLQYCPRCGGKYTVASRREETAAPAERDVRDLLKMKPEEQRATLRQFLPLIEAFKALGGADMFTDAVLRKQATETAEAVKDLAADVNEIGRLCDRIRKKVGA